MFFDFALSFAQNRFPLFRGAHGLLTSFEGKEGGGEVDRSGEAGVGLGAPWGVLKLSVNSAEVLNSRNGGSHRR